jgi:predicted kinase
MRRLRASRPPTPPPGLQAAAREHLAAAEFRSPPRLLAIGGLSGTGKSTLARELAPETGAAPGAVVLRSDVIRKSLFGVSPTTPLGAEAYTASVTEQVYRTLAARASEVMRAGHSVIVDAVHGTASERATVAAVAGAASGSPACGWRPPEVWTGRADARQADRSDATADVEPAGGRDGEADGWEQNASGTGGRPSPR